MHVDGQQRTIDQFQFGSVLFDEAMIMVKDGDSGQVQRWHIVDGEPRKCMAQPDSMIWNEDLKGTDPTDDPHESIEVDSSAGPRRSRLVDRANDGGTRSSFKKDDRRMIQGDLGF